MTLCFLILLQSYLALYSNQSNEAIEFINNHKEVINRQLKELTKEEKDIAIAIVAPEISQYSTMKNFIELRTLFVMYRNYGRADFSVGYFAMKPSFVEALETEIINDKSLLKNYSGYLPTGDEVTKRETRLKRLSSIQWQLNYLKLFIVVVKKKTKDINFKDPEIKLRYWATLYNSGFNKKPNEVKSYQQKKLFPHGSNKFNYSDIAVEFYKQIKLLDF